MHVHSFLVCVKRVKGKGRGVFALRDIAKGTLIECVPVVLMPLVHIKGGIDNSWLSKCAFVWRTKEHVALPLGYGPIYNHSYSPNADYFWGSGLEMRYEAIRDIKEGDEICINYNGDPKDRTDVGFEVV